MGFNDSIVVAVIGVVVIEGVWLAALTYLMWRRKRKRLEPEQAQKTGTP